MQLNVGVRAKHARKPFCNTQAGYPESTALVESYCTTIVLQSLSGPLLHVVQAL